MRMIDERGRLFGKLNLIDAAVALLFLLLIPIGYGAYLLFRAPTPRILAVEPAQVTQGQDVGVQIRGEHLRPFLRAAFGSDVAKGFLIESPSRAEVKLPDLPPGTYDLVLYDESREVAREREAVTVVSPPRPAFILQVLGKFAALEEDAARRLEVGASLTEGAGRPEVAVVLALEAMEPAVQAVRVNPATVLPTLVPGRVQVPAILRLRCALGTEGCRIDSTLVARDASLSLFRGAEALKFVIEEVRSVDAPVAFPSPPPIPTAIVQVLGKFAGLDAADVLALRVGWKFPEGEPSPVAEVLALQATEPAMERVRVGGSVTTTPIAGRVQVPAILRLRCALGTDGCRVGNTLVARDVSLSLFRGAEALSFVIEEVRSADAPVAFPSAPSAPTAVVQVLGKFAGLDLGDVPALRVGLRFPEDGTPPVAEVLAVQAAEPAQQRVRVGGNVTTTPVAGKVQIPAILRLRCTLANDGCHVGEVVTAPEAVLSLPRRKDEVTKFVVEEVRSTDTPAAFFSPKTATAELLVRFIVRPEVFSLVKAGDKAASSSPSPFAVGRRDSATLTSIGKEQVLRSLVSLELDPSPIRAHQVEQQVTAFEATVRAPVHETLNGWQHNGEPVKIGAVFSFETPLYIMRGWILRVTLPSARAEAQPPPS